MPLIDSFQRKIEYLRFSVIDQCNIRCQYCMPPEQKLWEKQPNLLTFDEICRMVTILASLGVRRVRITGGEPLVRKGVPDLIRRLNDVSDLDEVLLTTNGIPLPTLARPLRDAGLEKINIHLDTLSAEKFCKITYGGDIRKVLTGIEESQRVGLQPIKLNAVLQKGINDDEVEDLLRFTANHGLILRLIEMMPIGPGRELMPSLYMPVRLIREKLAEKYTLSPTNPHLGGGPAVYYRVKELNTVIGFISPVSEPFCGTCNRIRISSDGRFQDCLAFDGTFSFRDLLRNPLMTDERIAAKVHWLLSGKAESHDDFQQAADIRTPCMTGIGG